MKATNEITPEHLGQDATDLDAQAFREAVIGAEEMTVEEAIEYFWNGGDWVPKVAAVVGPAPTADSG
jgi:hypothetical protein